MGQSNSKKIADNLIQWLRQYATTHIDPFLSDEQRNIPPHVLLDFGNRGMFGLHVSRKYGGLELKITDMLRVIEQLGAIDLTLTTLVIESIQGAHTLEKYATESMKTRYLYQLASGRIFTAGAMTESAAGSNPRAMKSTATPNQQGEWVLRGSKRWVGMGASAEIIAIYVQEFDANNNWLGMTGFLVPKNADGLKIGPESPTMGLRGFAKNTIYMNHITVTPEQRLGKSGCGMEIAQDNMMFIRLCLAAASLGAMKKCMQLLVRYADRRTIATGQLIENPVTLMRLSELTAIIDAIACFLNVIATCYDKAPSHVPEEAFIASKIIGSEYLNWTTDLLVQTLGARGYEEASGVSKIFRDARVFKIFEGPTEALNMYVGSRAITKNPHLTQFIQETLNQTEEFDEIKLTIKTLHERYLSEKNQLFVKPFAIQYWIQAVIGEIMIFGLLLLSLKYAVEQTPSKRSERALIWARQHFNEIVKKAFRTLPAEKILLSSNQLHEFVSHYADAIGNIEQPRTTIDNSVDSLLRCNQNTDVHESTYYREHELQIEHQFLTPLTEQETLDEQTLVVTETERQKLLHAWNNTEHEKHIVKRCVHHRFEDQAALTPKAIALTFYDQKITYEKLNIEANRVAHYLLKKGIKPNDLVAIYMERSLHMIIGLLGILKSGAAYLPLDHHYPKKSVEFMYIDSGAQTLLTHQVLQKNATFKASKTIYIENILNEPNTSNPSVDLPITSLDSLGYLIYTSGSTNTPKGVMLPHRALANLINWHLQKIHDPRHVLQFTTLNFDMSFLEIFSALCSGGTLVLMMERDRVDLFAFANIIKKQQIEQLIISVPFLKSLVNAALDKKYFASLKEIIIAGEQLLITSAILSFFNQLNGCQLYNYYGPSETHVVTAYDFPENTAEWPEYPPIGRAIDNTKILILDDEQQLVPVGVSGEIYIGGENLAMGYVNQAKLTQDKFILDPWGEKPHDKLYRTGDFGKYQSDGNLVFLGRKDEQIKIRGFRIEPQEIELQLLKYPNVQEAVVIAKQDHYANKHLEAFIVLKSGYDEFFHEGIHAYLKEHLPQHMIPTTFNVIESMPLTSSGKINRSALEKYGRSNSCSIRKIIEPKTQTEKIIIAIMENIFKLHIGINNSYTSIGGNSLLAMEIVAQLQEKFSIEIPAFSLLSDPTIGDTAKRIDYLLTEQATETAFH